MGCCRRRARIIAPLLFCLGTVAVIVSCAIRWKVVPEEVESEIKKNLVLEPSNKEMWDNFVEPPVPIFMSFRFFDVSNPDEVKKGKKPKLVEKGPYVYSSVKRKIEIERDGQETLSYSDFRSYTYDQAATNNAGCSYNGRACTKDDEITIIHPIITFMGTLFDMIPWDMVGALKPLLLALINANTGEGKDDIFLKTKVDKILYQGEEIKLLQMAFSLIVPMLAQKPELAQVLENLPAQISKDGKFGFFLGDNGKAKYRLRVNDGGNDLAQFLQFEAFQGGSALPAEWWSQAATDPAVNENQANTTKNTCFDLRGTDGTQFAPSVDSEKDLWIFSSELCRSFWLTFEEEVEIKGITTKRFHPEPDVFSMSLEENKCFCPEFEKCRKLSKDGHSYLMDECETKYICMNGVLRMTGCFGGAPIYMSQPHFLNGDKRLGAKVEGLKPSKADHDTFLHVEPMTGAVMSAHKRIQVSLEAKAVKELTVFNPVFEQWKEPFLFPVFWGDEGADVDDKNADLFKDKVGSPLKIANGLTLTFIVLGSILIVASWVMVLFLKSE